MSCIHDETINCVFSFTFWLWCASEHVFYPFFLKTEPFSTLFLDTWGYNIFFNLKTFLQYLTFLGMRKIQNKVF